MKAIIALALFAAPAIAADHPSEAWELTLESGYLWNIGNNTAIDYEIAPTQFTLRSPVVLTWWEDENGARLVVRSRASLLLESIVEGPEDYYIGINGAPSIEYWFPNEKTSLFFSIGGGVGWTNSTGNPEGQGQDFTLNWFGQLGVSRTLTQDWSVRASAMFQHLSNGGQTNPNPGLDSLGILIGLSRDF